VLETSVALTNISAATNSPEALERLQRRRMRRLAPESREQIVRLEVHEAAEGEEELEEE